MEDVFPNPIRVKAEKQWRHWEMFGMVEPTLAHPRQHDAWCYRLPNGETYSHPTEDGARRMLAKHLAGVDGWARNLKRD